jgi:hypothetical protein
VSLPPSHDEWLALIPIGGYPVHDLEIGGHLIVVSQPGLIQAQCRCGWSGPDRTDDHHAEELVIDDTSWHCHEIGTECPDWRCLTCREETP